MTCDQKRKKKEKKIHSINNLNGAWQNRDHAEKIMPPN